MDTSTSVNTSSNTPFDTFKMTQKSSQPRTTNSDGSLAIRESAFPFLKLPAELRNVVYDLAAEQSASLLQNQQAAPLTRNLPETSTDGKPAVKSKLPSRRQFLGLTQVCHEIRREFRPIYVDRNELFVRAPESAAFLNMLFETDAVRLTDEELTAWVTIDIAPIWLGEVDPGEEDYEDYADYTCSILSTLKLCCADTSFGSRFKYMKQHSGPWPFNDQEANRAISLVLNHSRDEWSALVPHLEHLQLSMDSPYVTINGKFKKGALRHPRGVNVGYVPPGRFFNLDNMAVLELVRSIGGARMTHFTLFLQGETDPGRAVHFSWGFGQRWTIRAVDTTAPMNELNSYWAREFYRSTWVDEPVDADALIAAAGALGAGAADSDSGT